MNWHEYFTYDAESGNLIWKSRPDSHFSSAFAAAGWRTRFVGKVAGTKCRIKKTGMPFGVCLITRQRRALAHRVIWEMHYGPIPDGLVIDHKNGDAWDNRLSNLRLATLGQNSANNKARRSSTGYKGVWWARKERKYRATICYNYRSMDLGQFRTPEEAAMAYNQAAEKFWGAFANLNVIPSPKSE